MSLLRVAVADDEPIALKRLVRMLREAGCEIVGEWRDSEDLLEGLQSIELPDALFLDIQMPCGTGLEAMAELPPSLPVVFVTAFSDYAVRAYETNAVDYLLKPVFQDRLEKALDKVRERQAFHLFRSGAHAPMPAATPAPMPAAAPAPPTEPPPAPATRFPARAGSGHLFLDLRRVSHFALDEQGVHAWSGGKPFRTLWNALSEVETAFPASGLLRIQRHLLLRLESVIGHRSLPNGRAQVRVGDGLELEVSRSATPRLREWLGIGRT